ncbi:hypothetical protein JCM6882_006108 [Rhodosporidiobolus microsporus]
MSRPAADTLSFTPTHTLLNPRFESYKLSAPSPSLSSDLVSRSFALPTPFETPHLPEHARLSYSEVSARARHNHLAAGRKGEVLWVDGKEGEVWAVEVDKKTAQPTFHSLGKLPPLPTSTNPSTAPPAVPEYPTALPLAPHLWAISSGRGTLHLLRVDTSSSPSGWTSTVEASFELRDEEGEGEVTPFRLHAVNVLPAAEGTAGEAIVLLSKVVKSSTSSSSSSDPASTAAFDSTPSSSSTTSAQAKTRLKLASHTSFEFLSCRLSLSPSSVPQRLSVDWRLQADDLPAFVEFDAQAGRYCVGAGAVLKPVVPAAAAPESQSAGEREQAAGAMDLDDGVEAEPSAAAAEEKKAATGPKPPPFSWLQDGDSLTVAFPIPSDTPTSSIRITFSRQYLSLFVASPRAAASTSSPFASELPKLSHKKLWGDIDPHTSVWTFDREAEGRNSTFGLLTLHLEKAHAGTKWPDVFAPTASTAAREASETKGEGAKIVEVSAEEEYENVPETVDPSELAAVAEKMEQWAQGIVQSSSALGGGAAEGLGSGLPSSLVGDEMDVEVDGESGRPVVVNWVEGAATAEKKAVEVVTPHRTIPYSLLSTALPLSSTSTSPLSSSDPTITIKHDVDALLFSPPSSIPPSPTYAWQHLATLPALAFVLATKRDTRFVYHLRSSTSPALLQSAGVVLAFDAPAIIPGPSSPASAGKGGGNLFVYVSPPAGSKAQTGRSMVLRVGSGVGGAVVGAVGVELEGGEVAVVVLCERELVVMRLFAA